MTTNRALADRYRAVLPSWLHLLYENPIAIERGEGGYVWDVEGKRYLDFFGGVLTTMVGHANPAVTDAVTAQVEKVMHTSTLYASEPTIELAEEIAAISGIPDARVFFTTSGSEANETALLLATAHRGTNEVLALRTSYHGRSFATQAVTAQSAWTSTTLSGLAVSFVHGGYRLRSPFRELDDERYVDACVADLEQVIEMMTSGAPACLIVEPIQGVGGFICPPDGLFGSFAKVLSNHGSLFISDEVQTGWGRTGDHFWGYQAHDIVPDILTFAKGAGNGATLAGVVARSEIMDSINALSFSTFGGNPVAAAAGLATLHYVRENDLQSNARVMGHRLSDGLIPMVDRYSVVAELRGRGLMQALEFVRPGSDEPAPELATAFAERCCERGLLVGKGGLFGNVVRIAPMLDVTAKEIDEGLEALTDAIDTIADSTASSNRGDQP